MRLADALRAEEILENRIAACEAELAAAVRERAVGQGAVNVDRLLTAQRHELTLRAEAAELAEQQETLRQEIKKRRSTVAAADGELQAVEKLIEHRNEAAKRKQRQRQTRELLELALTHPAAGEANL